MPQILVCGSAVTDMVFDVDAFPVRPEKYVATNARIVGGGCAGNAAVAIARLGGEALLSARMGPDLIGDLTLEGLQAEGVDCTHVLRGQGGKSAYSSILVTPDGERLIVAFRGSDLPDTPDYTNLKPAAVLADTRWPTATEAALKLARALDIPGVLDGEAPVVEATALLASHVAFSAQGLREFTGEKDIAPALDAAKSRLGTWVSVTDGANGTWIAGTPHIRIPAFPVEVVDTLGAGDVWHGAFTLALAEGQGEEAAIRFASAAAALKCTRPGGREGAPTRAEVEDFLRRMDA